MLCVYVCVCVCVTRIQWTPLIRLQMAWTGPDITDYITSFSRFAYKIDSITRLTLCWIQVMTGFRKDPRDLGFGKVSKNTIVKKILHVTYIILIF